LSDINESSFEEKLITDDDDDDDDDDDYEELVRIVCFYNGLIIRTLKMIYVPDFLFLVFSLIQKRSISSS